MAMMTEFSRRLLAWYDRHGRKDLPWQQSCAPYPVWVSEIMLQQTQVTTVIPYYQRFMASYPDVTTLANAAQDEVLHHWSGLGYYARARNLHKAAQQVRDRHGGDVPVEFEPLIALPGIGRSTAGAIIAFSTGQRHAILDGNVKRVLTRLHAVAGWPGQTEVEHVLWRLALDHTPVERVQAYTQAIMDFGATRCRRSRPDCDTCPMADICQARQQDAVAEYPAAKPRKALAVRQVQFLLLQNEVGEVLLQQRPPTGIWGGLWALPELAAGESLQEWCRERYGMKLEHVDYWAPLRHSFSHFHLDIQPIYCRIVQIPSAVMEPSGIVWYNCHFPEAIGLAAPVQRLLIQLMNNPVEGDH